MHIKYALDGYREHFKQHPIQETPKMKDEQIKHMVDRFLWWKLPDTFKPDCGIQFDADAAKKMNPRNSRYEPVGTNLFTATEAREMVRHMAEGLPDSASVWLIEWPADDNLPVRWWHPQGGWMMDAAKAIRFARKEDGEAYAASSIGLIGRPVTEHIFL